MQRDGATITRDLSDTCGALVVGVVDGVGASVAGISLQAAARVELGLRVERGASDRVARVGYYPLPASPWAQAERSRFRTVREHIHMHVHMHAYYTLPARLAVIAIICAVLTSR